MNRQVVLRLLDTFFRHFWLYLLPVVLLGGVGVWAASSVRDSYQSFATMRVESSALVAEVTGSQQDPGFGWQSPAAATADSFNALLRTRTFVDDVVAAAGLEQALATGAITADQVRSSIAVYPDGTRLVKVQGTNRNPDVAYRLAGAAMETYVQAVIDHESSDSRVAIDFLEQKLPEYRAAVDQAEAALARWLEDNPAPDDDSPRPEDEQVQVTRLQDAIKAREDQLTQTEASIERAQLSVEQKTAEVQQRLQMIDPPEVPTAPQPKMRKMFMTVAMALVLGCFFSVVAVVVGTILDRTIRFPGDVRERLDARMLAVVPRARMSTAMRKRLETEAASETPTVVPVPAEPPGDAESGRSDTVASDGRTHDQATAGEGNDDADELPLRPVGSGIGGGPLRRVP